MEEAEGVVAGGVVARAVLWVFYCTSVLQYVLALLFVLVPEKGDNSLLPLLYPESIECCIQIVR